MKRYIKKSAEVKAVAELDARFDFDLDDTFEIYLGNDRVTCYVVDDYILGGGAGVAYVIVIPVGDKDHWQMGEWIERGLDEFFTEQTDGSDYTYAISGDITKESSAYTMLPADVDDYNTYMALVEVVPYQNIGPDGEYGIDYGTEDYLDHITKGTPFPRED